jgi:hypothetical protein
VALFKSDPSIAFPGSELTSLIRNDAGQFTLTTKFLGFSGSQSPLPGYYLDRMAQESAQNEEGLAAFLDLFSHRWTQFAYHAWRKYRYYICFRNGGTDGFSQRMYALVGLGNKSVRDLPSTTAKCWPTREYWQRRAARLTWYATWSLTVLIYRMSSLITGSCVKYRSICHSRTGWVCVIRGCPSATNLLTPWSTVFQPTRCRRCVLKASPRRATFFPAGDSAFQRQIL